MSMNYFRSPNAVISKPSLKKIRQCNKALESKPDPASERERQSSGGKSSEQQATVCAGVWASAAFCVVEYVLIEIQLNRPLTKGSRCQTRDGKHSLRAVYWLFRVERLPTVQPYILLVITRALKTGGSLELWTRKAWLSVSPGNPAQHQWFTVGYKRRFLPLGPHLAVVKVTASIM
ncbi:uncharacterized protein LOC144121991 isoform X3 [Amblyomma americanum]